MNSMNTEIKPFNFMEFNYLKFYNCKLSKCIFNSLELIQVHLSKKSSLAKHLSNITQQGKSFQIACFFNKLLMQGKMLLYL